MATEERKIILVWLQNLQRLHFILLTRKHFSLIQRLTATRIQIFNI